MPDGGSSPNVLGTLRHHLKKQTVARSYGDAVTGTTERFPLGASLTVEDLQGQPYEALAMLRESEPVSWVPAMGAWFITRRDLAVEAMRDAEAFTVDDPRFSTARVIGESMLSLEGAEHDRHRRAFATHFRPTILREDHEAGVVAEARSLVLGVSEAGTAELRTAVAGPLAVRSITQFLGLGNVEPGQVLTWYRHLASAIEGAALGEDIPPVGRQAFEELHLSVSASLREGSSDFLQRLEVERILRPEEVATATAVVMFGAIETSEGMTANVLWHLLSHPGVLDELRADRSKVAAAIEESLRLEPAAAVVDRYTTRTVEIGGVEIPERDMVTISLLGANRDPDVFPQPDRFDINRQNLRQHVTFVQGPHGCIGLHLARMETMAAVHAVLDLLPDIALNVAASEPPTGLIFRKPAAVTATWTAGSRAAALAEAEVEAGGS